MTVSRYKLKDKQYNYLLQWVAGLFWLMESIDRNRSVTIVNMQTRIDEKRTIIPERLAILVLSLITILSKQPKLGVKIPIVHRQSQHQTKVTAVSSMWLYSTPA